MYKPWSAEQLVAKTGVSSEAAALYRDCDVFDLHIESYIWTRLWGYDLHQKHGKGLLNGRLYSHVDVPKAIEGGLTGACWSIATNFVRRRVSRERYAKKHIAQLIDMLSQSDKGVEVVQTVSQYHEVRARGHHAAFIGIQGGNVVDELEHAQHLDERISRVTLVHMSNSHIGDTSAPFKMSADRGLSADGHSLCEMLRDRRILIDLAHMGARGVEDVCQTQPAGIPLAMTHTASAHIRPHWRNASDVQLRAIAETGGVAGIILNWGYLTARWHAETKEVIMPHLDHMINVMGEDGVSIGTDWDGFILPPRDMLQPYTLVRLVDWALERGWSEARIRKLMGGNALRMMSQLRS